MIKKRFTKYVPDSYGYTYTTTIIDNEKNKQTGNIDEIVDMLNELSDENKKLKRELSQLEYNNGIEISRRCEIVKVCKERFEKRNYI